MENIMNTFITQQIEDSYLVKQKILNDASLVALIQEIAQKAVDTYKNGNKTLIAGNGGSAADAQHIAGEFVSKFYFD
ncbi:MAG: SIS domain-containing protein, partial [Methyloprofundus sp.]|nr:SIS domain-containing protein [Methyloprofundus sp.]